MHSASWFRPVPDWNQENNAKEIVDIPIYQQIRARIKPQAAIGASVENL
jgi:hypothetical protein